MANQVELNEARWKGTIDLDAEVLKETTLDGLMFAVVAYRVEELGATKLMSDGRRRRKDVYNVEDARILTGHLRDQAVQFLAMRGELTAPMSELPNPEHVVEESPAADVDEVSASITELKREVRREVLSDDDEVEVEGVVGSIHDYRKTATPEPSGRSGPKVGKFDPDGGLHEESSVVSERGHVGSIRPPEYKGKDKALKRFIEEAQ